MEKIEAIDWGLMEYGEAQEKQKAYFQSNIDKKHNGEPTRNYLFLVEHPPVYTLGKNGDEKHILPIARESGASFYHVNRGGDITFHGPGQLVAYPILDLQSLNMGLAQYVYNLEQVGIDLCLSYGIEATRAEKENGVWLDVNKPNARKIMALGIKSSRYITMHGIAFNVNTDLRYFDYIIPCGIQNKGVTSLAIELGNKIDFENAKQLYVDRFLHLFLNQ